VKGERLPRMTVLRVRTQQTGPPRLRGAPGKAGACWAWALANTPPVNVLETSRMMQ
jgi:hypothetical protein